jgi:MoaA/NifB/PqqE/SkfB family radical SAM enzyme
VSKHVHSLRVLPHMVPRGDRSYETHLRSSYDSGEVQVRPLQVVLVLQESCNVKCIYCPYVSGAVAYEKRWASTAQWSRMIDELAEFGVKHVRFSGGEPTLRKDLVHLVARATERKLNSAIVTNGLRLTTQLADGLMTAGLGALTLSIDSLDPATYELTRTSPYQQMMQALEVVAHMKRSGSCPWIGVNCVVTKHNADTIPALVEGMTSRRISVQFMPVHSFDGDENKSHAPDVTTMARLVDQLIAMKRAGMLINSSEPYLEGMVAFTRTGKLPDDFECSAGYLQVVIDPDLGVRPCCLIDPVESVRDVRLADVWNGAGLREARRKIKDHDCPRCWLMYVDAWK